MPFEPQALRAARARRATARMRDALSLTDQAIAYSAGQVTEEAVRGMLGALDQSYLIRLLDALRSGRRRRACWPSPTKWRCAACRSRRPCRTWRGLLHRIAWAQFAPSSVLDEWPEAADIRRFAEALIRGAGAVVLSDRDDRPKRTGPRA